MEKKERTINVVAMSDYGMTVQITLTVEVDDLTNPINKAISKIEEFKKNDKTLKIVHIDTLKNKQTQVL